MLPKLLHRQGERLQMLRVRGVELIRRVERIGGVELIWANSGTNSIGRANLNGTGPDPNFITGAAVPTGVAVDGAHVYWTAFGGEIGRADLDGMGVIQNFIVFATSPIGVAVDSDSAHTHTRPSTGPTSSVTRSAARSTAQQTRTASGARTAPPG